MESDKSEWKRLRLSSFGRFQQMSLTLKFYCASINLSLLENVEH